MVMSAAGIRFALLLSFFAAATGVLTPGVPAEAAFSGAEKKKSGAENKEEEDKNLDALKDCLIKTTGQKVLGVANKLDSGVEDCVKKVAEEKIKEELDISDKEAEDIEEELKNSAKEVATECLLKGAKGEECVKKKIEDMIEGVEWFKEAKEDLKEFGKGLSAAEEEDFEDCKGKVKLLDADNKKAADNLLKCVTDEAKKDRGKVDPKKLKDCEEKASECGGGKELGKCVQKAVEACRESMADASGDEDKMSNVAYRCTKGDKMAMFELGGGSAPGTFPHSMARCANQAFQIFTGLNYTSFGLCMKKETRITNGCAACFAGASASQAFWCGGACMFSWCSQPCLACTWAYRATHLKSCVGFAAPEPQSC